MALARAEKAKLKGFVDQYMSHYVKLRSDGFSCEDASQSIYTSYTENVHRHWDELSFESQIFQWNNLTFGDHVKEFRPKAREEERIVTGLLNALPIVCPKSKNVLPECEAWVRSYLRREFDIDV